MSNIIRKLSSRKLWVAVAGIATGIALAIGVDGGDISTVAGAMTSILSVVAYIVTEGKIDAESVKLSIENTQIALEAIEEAEKY